MSGDLLATSMWSELGTQAPTILYTTAVDLIRKTASTLVDNPSNQTREYNDTTIRDAPHGFFLVCCISFSVFGTILNLLAILTICSLASRVRQDATHTFILNLSIADLLLSIFVIPAHWLQIVFRKVDVIGELLCDVSQLAFFWIFELSLFTLSVVSINR